MTAFYINSHKLLVGLEIKALYGITTGIIEAQISYCVCMNVLFGAGALGSCANITSKVTNFFPGSLLLFPILPTYSNIKPLANAN